MKNRIWIFGMALIAFLQFGVRGTCMAGEDGERMVAPQFYEVCYDEWDAKGANDIAEALAWILDDADPGLEDDEDDWFLPYCFLDWYDELDVWEDFKKWRESFSALCTSCRNGDFVGRNFDWAYDDVDEYLMRVPAANGRLASIGVASKFFPEPVQTLFGVENFLPELTMDGVNEKGVAINVNVVPAGDNGATTGTNPGKERLCAGFAVRAVLDNATNAAHAVEVLQSRDVYSIPFLEFHWMISDSNESYVVECVSNQLVVLKAKAARPKMANFYVSHSPNVAEYDVVSTNADLIASVHTPHAMGIERYARVADGLERVDSTGDMLARMIDVWYKPKYLPGNELRYWSDLNGMPIPGEDGRFAHEDGRDDKRMEAFAAVQANYIAVTNYEATYESRTILFDDTLTNGVVHTVHTSVYDLRKREISVCVQERKTPFRFALADEPFANATAVFVNGENVGIATECRVADAGWTYDRATKTLTLLGRGPYAIHGLADAGVTIAVRGNPPALGCLTDLSDAEKIVIRADAQAKFEADPVWSDYGYLFEVEPVRYHGFKTLAPFLHEIWYDDYTFDADGETLSKEARFSCSSVRNGNFIGRNFDFFLNDTPEFIVHVAADPSRGRLASVGVATHAGLREDGVTNGTYTASYDLIPNRMLDGINERGVAINQNVVAYDPEVAAGPGREFRGTNPDGEDLNISFVTRLVLDRATNAAHAVELIKSRNLVGMSVSGDLLHYMVSDKDETYVVEIITNTVVARHMTVMTNFNLNWDNANARAVTDADAGWGRDDYPEPWRLAEEAGGMSAITNAIAQRYAKHAEGVERFVRLRDNYDEGATFEGMANLLRRVRYSQAATFETQPYWYSDRTSVAVDEMLSAAGYPDAANIRMLYALKYSGNIKLDELLDENLMADERKYLADKDRYRKDDTGVWFTVHNTTYDLAKRMFRIVVQEDYAKSFDVWLDETNVSCTVAVRDSGKVLGEADPASLATNFTLTVTGAGFEADDFAGYCVRAKGEAAGTYAINFVCTRMPEIFPASAITVVPGVFTITDTEDIRAQWRTIDATNVPPGRIRVRLGCDSAKGKVKGAKDYKLGSKGTVKVSIGATAAKGYVFAGWYLDPGFSVPASFTTGTGKNAKPKDYRNASQTLTASGNVYLFARFVEKTTKADPIVWLRYEGAGYCGADAGVLATEDVWYQGVALPTNGCQVMFGSASLPTVKISGLPAGVKFDKATFRFTGVPTKASTEKKPFFTVKVTIKNKSGATDVLVKNVRVEPLPAWAVGNFAGAYTEFGDEKGVFTATVGKTGKFSGKIKVGKDTVTLSAKNFSGVESLDGALCYFIDPTIKYKDPITRKTVTTLGSLVLADGIVFGEDDAGRAVRANRK